MKLWRAMCRLLLLGIYLISAGLCQDGGYKPETNVNIQAARNRLSEGSSKLIITTEFNGYKFGPVQEFWVDKLYPVSVYYMQRDEYKTDDFLISYDLGLGSISPKTNEFNSICGNDRSNPEYKEGIGANAKFGSIRSFAQHNESTVIIVDGLNHCIRTVNKNSHQSAQLAGQCKFDVFTQQPILDGSFDEAVFNSPYDIAKGTVENEYFVLDSSKRALRKLDLGSNTVSTIYRAPEDNPTIFRSPRTMIFSDPLYYVGVSGGIVTVDISTGKMEEVHIGAIGLADDKLKEGAKFQKPESFQLLDKRTLIFMETWLKEREAFIRLVDLESNEVRSLNITELGPKQERVHSQNCLLHDPDQRRIYIGGDEGLSMVEYEDVVSDGETLRTGPVLLTISTVLIALM